MIFCCEAHTLGLMTWDPFGTLRRTLWIGGGQWAGKSTVSNILAERFGVTAYHFDYHAARGHLDRRIVHRVAQGRPAQEPHPDDVWVHPTPEAMAAGVIAGFHDQFEWVLDDLRALVSGRPIIAEGWGLRPALVAPIVEDLRQIVVMVPTEAWRQHQLRVLPRAGGLSHAVSDPERAQRNRVERDRIVAAEAVESAHRLGIRVIEVDGTLDAEGVAGLVADHFAPFLGPQRLLEVQRG